LEQKTDAVGQPRAPEQFITGERGQKPMEKRHITPAEDLS